MYEKGQSLLKTLHAKVIKNRVEDLIYLPKTQQWKISLKIEKYETIFDELHLCCGDLPVMDPYSLESSPHYIAAPYPIKELGRMNWTSEPAAVVGTGLAAVDVIKWLVTQTKVSVNAFSRSNYFPTVRVLDGPDINWSIMSDAIFEDLRQQESFSFQTFNHLFEKQLQELGFRDWNSTLNTYLAPDIKGIQLAKKYPSQLYLLQQLASRVADWFTDLWPLMTNSDRKNYQDMYGKAIINLRNPMPEDSAKSILEAAEQGRLNILNQVSDISASEKGFVICSQEKAKLVVNHVINAIGYHLRPSNYDKANSLLRSLLNQRLAQVDHQGGLTVLPQTAQVISPRYGLLPTLRAHGTLINGVIYQNNSIIKIQKIAERAIGSHL